MFSFRPPHFSHAKLPCQNTRFVMLEFPVTHVQVSQTNISIRRGSPVCYYFNYVQSSMLGNRACAMSLSLTRKRLLMYHALET